MDGGCLPHWDEALDESTGIIEAVYFAPCLYGGRSPPYNYSAKYTASIIPVDSSKASCQWGNQTSIPWDDWDDHPNAHPNGSGHWDDCVPMCIKCLNYGLSFAGRMFINGALRRVVDFRFCRNAESEKLAPLGGK